MGPNGHEGRPPRRETRLIYVRKWPINRRNRARVSRCARARVRSGTSGVEVNRGNAPRFSRLAMKTFRGRVPLGDRASRSEETKRRAKNHAGTVSSGRDSRVPRSLLCNDQTGMCRLPRDEIAFDRGTRFSGNTLRSVARRGTRRFARLEEVPMIYRPRVSREELDGSAE